MTEETRLIYFDDSYLFESKATILEMRDREEGMKSIILDKTIFYPQGGGQPYDTGIVSGDGVEFDVQETRFEDGIVHHIGEFSNGNLNKGQPVELKINEENRRLHCKIHSGGHLVDVAMYNIDREFPSGKGFHFREGSYVEYTGFIEVDERPAAIEALNRELEKMIQTGSEITSQSVDTREELEVLCKFVPENIPTGKPIRVVTVGGVGCPCGGTHVKNTNELTGLYITKLKVKSERIRVSYSFR